MTILLGHAVRKHLEATLRWRARAVVVTMMLPEVSEALLDALARNHGALRKESDELAGALRDVAAHSKVRKQNIAKGLADWLDRIRNEVDTLPEDVILPRARYVPPVIGTTGGLRGLGAGPRTWAQVEQTLIGVTNWVARGLGFVAVGTGAYLAYDRFMRSPVERAREDAQVLAAMEAERQAALAKCASDPDPAACKERVNKTFDALAPSQCDILDTPLGSALGLLVGGGAGYVGMRKLMGVT